MKWCFQFQQKNFDCFFSVFRAKARHGKPKGNFHPRIIVTFALSRMVKENFRHPELHRKSDENCCIQAHKKVSAFSETSDSEFSRLSILLRSCKRFTHFSICLCIAARLTVWMGLLAGCREVPFQYMHKALLSRMKTKSICCFFFHFYIFEILRDDENVKWYKHSEVV
jgi:hypothetical protein